MANAWFTVFLLAACGAAREDAEESVAASAESLIRSGPGGGPPNMFTYGQGWRVETHLRLVTPLQPGGPADIVGFYDNGMHVLRGEPGGYKWSSGYFPIFGTDQGWRLADHVRTLADVDADGRLDVVGFGDTGVMVSRAGVGLSYPTPTTWLEDFGSTTGWDHTTATRTVGDLDADGRADLIVFAADGVHTARSTGDGFEPAQLASAHFGEAEGYVAGKHPRLAMDVNADGRVDLIGFGPNDVSVALGLEEGGFTDPAVWTTRFSEADGWNEETHVRTLADVNGDTFLDVVGFGPPGVLVGLGYGVGCEEPSVWLANLGDAQGWTPAKHPRFVGDVDGDGMADVIGMGTSYVYVGRSQGDSFAPLAKMTSDFSYTRGWRTEKHPRFVADANGDGKLDAIGFDDTSVQWMPLTPSSDRQVLLPVCEYDTDMDSFGNLFWSYEQEWLCKPWVNGAYTGSCGWGGWSATCPNIESEFSAKPSQGQYLVRPNLTGQDQAYGSNIRFSDGSTLYGAISVECKRPNPNACNDYLEKAQVQGNWEVATGKAKLADVEGGFVHGRARVTGWTTISWVNTCSTCSDSPPKPNDVQLVIQQQRPDGVWQDIASRTVSSSKAKAFHRVETYVDGGNVVRFQLRGESPGDQPHFQYLVHDARMAVELGRDAVLPICTWAPEEMSMRQQIEGNDPQFQCRTQASGQPSAACAMGSDGRPAPSTYFIRRAMTGDPAAGYNHVGWSGIPISFPDGSGLRMLKRADCKRDPAGGFNDKLVSSVLQGENISPAGTACNDRRGLVGYVTNRVNRSTPGVAYGSVTIYEESNVWIAGAALHLQVLMPAGKDQLQWTTVATKTYTAGEAAGRADHLHTFAVGGSVPAYADVRVVLEGRHLNSSSYGCRSMHYDVRDFRLFASCDPREPGSCD